MTISQVKVGSTTHDITLPGLTASVTELNYADGVTSNIQTQLDNKAPTNHASDATTYGVGSANNYGHLKVGSNISVSSGTISLASSNVTAALGYTPLSTAGGTVTGNITAPNFIGVASSASAFNSDATIALSGDVTGTAASTHGWSINTSLTNNAVTTSKIADNAITTAKIANSAVATAKIADNAITTAKITDSSITAAKIADNAIGTTEIANGSVTVEKLADEIGVVVVQSAEPSADSAAKIWIKI